ncbi:telomerase-binding protein EST1A [Zeugodacus cucurbitae]|uniref:telomerase-binding protein EST1A n=1 Tax=Zeugodacus cucurbitae TaxID=28588 RepID=UPI0023D96172|nr:telomerase-binding protein EST1A [Zeugodacus cucurbitae]
MNQKGAREQNDISIIRNLPKRLQQRLVEDVGDNSLVTVVDTTRQSSSGQPSTSKGGAKNDDNDKISRRFLQKQNTTGIANQQGNGAIDVTSIDFFLQKSAPSTRTLNKNNLRKETVPVLETSGKSVESKPNNIKCATPTTNSNVSNSSIPGILRLNDTKHVQLIAAEKSKNCNEKNACRDNGKKTTARMHQINDQYTKDDNILTKSPARQLQRQLKPPPWFDMLTGIQYVEQLPKLYEKVTSFIQQNKVIENWPEFNEARLELQNIFTNLLLQQLKLCCEQKIDTFFWKLLYYNVREYFISNSKLTAADGKHNRLLLLIDDGLDFYTKLHMKLNTKYINTDQKHTANNITIEKEAPTQRSTHKFEFIAKVAAQKLLICLGDLCRYKTKELQTNDYTDAAKYYQQAQTLIPTNGIPYNQLAILSIYARKKFDAVYFHMRSLMSSNAIYSARESLLVLFDEIRKKYEETELKTSPVHQGSPRNNNSRNSKSMRKEVWIHVDGVRRLHHSAEPDNNKSKSVALKEEKKLKDLTSEELLRRFTSLYLYVIGKLYTGIGMESIVEQQRKLLAELNVLLSRSPFPMKRSRLLKIVALNIFSLEHNMHKESRREIRYYAFNFCNQFLGLLLRKCNQLYKTFKVDILEREMLCHADLNTLLQYINIYTDWLSRNVDIWEPVRSEEHIIIDCWTEWASFYEFLRRMIDESTINRAPRYMLEEELYLLGFTPIMSATNNSSVHKNVVMPSSNDSEQFFPRILKIHAFHAHYAKDVEKLLMHNDSFTLEELNGAMEQALCTLQSDEDDNSENIVVNGESAELTLKELNSTKTDCIEDAQISQLSRRKKELEARSNVKKMYSAKLEEILKFVDTTLYIEVRPKYLMPDTNCFIDCLDDFQKLINEYKRYILVIPLTVVKELDGLAKGVKVESYQNSLQFQRIHHYDDVSTCAKRSLDFIRSAKNNVKCATTKGSFINASLFALCEEENVSNDDKILATAVALSKTMSTETNKDGKYFIQTELVMITTDRNLRVKALARNLTVSEMGEFLKWVKDCHA